MFLKRLNWKILTVHDTEISNFCSRCHFCFSSSDSEATLRRYCVCFNFRKSMNKIRLLNMIFNKYLLIYFLIMISIVPLSFSIRHQDHPIERSLTEIAPSTKVKGLIVVDDSEKASEEENDDSSEDQETYQSSSEIRRMYKLQHEAFAKEISLKKSVESVKVVSTAVQALAESSCSSNACLARKDIEAANTESIRKHILMKLGMDENTLNKTNYPKLNEKLLETLCKNINISPEDCLGRKLTNVEYQSDDPVGFTTFDDFDEDSGVTALEEENVQIFSYENRIYAFPSSELLCCLLSF